MKKIFILVFVVILCVVSAYNIIQRINLETKQRQVMFVLDIDPLHSEEKIEQYVIEDIKKSGIKIVALNYGQGIISKINLLKKNGFKIILKISPKEKYSFEEIKTFVTKNKNYLTTVIINPSIYFSATEITSFYIKEYFKQCAKIVEQNKFLCINFEFKNYVLSKYINEYENIVRGFVADFNTINEPVLKIKKAVFERSCGVIYLLPIENYDKKESIKMITETTQIFKNKIQVVEDTTTNNFYSIKTNKIGNIIVLILAVILPILMYKKILAMQQYKIENLYFMINSISVIIGIISYGLLQDYGYVVLDKEVRWIKMMFVSPILLAPFFLLSKQELKSVLNYNLRIKDFLLLNIGLCIVFYIILRTGNIGRSFVLPYELEVRNIIEQVALFRPRFKEIFFGQPLLVVSLFLLKTNNKNIVTKIIFGLSIIGQVSIINTFLHIHSPLDLSLLRTLVGVIGGFIIGIICILIYKRMIKFNRIVPDSNR